MDTLTLATIIRGAHDSSAPAEKPAFYRLVDALSPEIDDARFAGACLGPAEVPEDLGAEDREPSD